MSSIAGVSIADVHVAAQKFILAIFDSKMRAEAKDVLILKTPDDIAFVDEILEIFPQSTVIHVRRDVRDVALSTQKAGWPNLNLFGKNNFANAVRRWLAWEQRIAAAKARSPDRIVSIRYEDLVAQPEPTLRRVLDKLRLRFDRAMLAYWRHEQDMPEWDTGSRDAVQFTKIEPARAFAYRKQAPSREQRRIIAGHDADIVALGYAPGWGE